MLLALFGILGCCGGPAAAQTTSGFVLHFSDYNNEPTVPITATTAVPTFNVVNGRLEIQVANTSTPIPGTTGPGPTISNVGFNVNPELALSLTDAFLKDTSLPPGASVSLDKNPILEDVHRSIYGDFEWMINFKGFGLAAGGKTTVSVGLTDPFTGPAITGQNNSLGWSGVAPFQQTPTGPGVADSTWSGSHSYTVTPEGSSASLLLFALLPLMGLSLIQWRSRR